MTTLKTALGPGGLIAGPHAGTITVAAHGGQLNTFSGGTGFTLSQPGITTKNFKAGTVTIKGEGDEEAEFDAAFINDLKLLLEVINELPDEHPMGDLKHDMRMRRAFKKLGG